MANEMSQIAALADPTRLAVFELVAEQPRSVAEITRSLPVTQSAVSQHLKVLREAQLVRSEPRGASNIYHVDPAGLVRMRAWLDRFWGSALQDFQKQVEQEWRDK
ncbi:ArsR/SmtB family transcription factor [Chelativorans oligotrophicus]|uniref:ArsR/SmtB family transcription factor n=1 Tax=Chelativorans oligotrophicus TaxID=449974 RepID=UPI00140A1E42|nr:metalloregulator ArsR/SmtB family transcription factor [Chelativorans oligotrophicus]